MAKTSLNSLAKSDVAKLLQQSGSRTASEESIDKDIQAGAPMNADGTMNFLHYIAWLLKESNNGD